MKKYILILSIALLIPTYSHAAFPDGCQANYKFSVTTGQECIDDKQPCQAGDLFNFINGKSCSEPVIDTTPVVQKQVVQTVTNDIVFYPPLGTWKLLYPTNTIDLSKSKGIDELAIVINNGKQRDIEAYITTPNGRKETNTSSHFGTYVERINGFYPTTAGTYNVKFEVPSLNLEENITVTFIGTR